jgi:hypothetical protein
MVRTREKKRKDHSSSPGLHSIVNDIDQGEINSDSRETDKII